MMAAMMLPGAAPVVLRRAHAGGGASGIGLMLIMAVLGVMSVTWMSVIAVLMLAQKLLPAKAALDMPLALAIVGLGALIVVAPSSVPGLTPAM
jgi:predicted metal-binding membrane protein